MRRLLYLAALCMAATLILAPAALAQDQYASTACDDVRDRLNAGDDTLTSAELLSCGLSPEAISPCEGVPDPNCNNEGFPSIGGPNGVGQNNACSGLPEGSPEAVACYEELIAGLGSPQYAQPETPSTRITPDGIQYSDLPDVIPGGTEQPVAEVIDEETSSTTTTTPLPDTGGIPLVPLAGASLLVLGLAGLAARRRIS